MDFGFTSVTFRQFSIEQIICLAISYQCDYIEWGGDVHVKLDDLQNAERVGRLTKTFGIKTSAYGSYFKLGVDNISEFVKVCEVAKRLETNIVRIWLGEKGSNLTSESEFLRLVEQGKEIAKIAKKYGITVASEFHKKTFNDSADSCLKFLNAVNCDNFKTYWQPTKHSKDMQIVKAIADKIVAVHIFNWTDSGVRLRLFPSKNRWIKILKNINNKNVFKIMEFIPKDKLEIFGEEVWAMMAILNGIEK